jgi:hypothetical protein
MVLLPGPVGRDCAHRTSRRDRLDSECDVDLPVGFRARHDPLTRPCSVVDSVPKSTEGGDTVAVEDDL